MALAGDHIIVKMQDSGGTVRTFANGDITSVDMGLTYKQHDVSGFGDPAQHFINAQIQAPVTLKGFVTTTTNTGTHTVINGAFATGAKVSLEVQVGNNTTPTTGDAKLTGDFYVESYKPALATGAAVTFEASLKPATGTAPSWGTV